MTTDVKTRDVTDAFKRLARQRVLSRHDPFSTAYELVDKFSDDSGEPTLCHYNGAWWEWRGRRGVWISLTQQDIRAKIWFFLDGAFDRENTRQKFMPRLRDVREVFEALKVAADIYHGTFSGERLDKLLVQTDTEDEYDAKYGG